MKHFCTIITAGYLPFAEVLCNSLRIHFKGEVSLHAFVADASSASDIDLKNLSPDIFCYFKDEINDNTARALHEKYASTFIDAYRWTMKPVFMKYLLKELNINRLIYLDSDIYFVGSGDFLLDMLSGQKILLTPHWRATSNPTSEPNNFSNNFTHGLFNAGFVGATADSIEILDYWAQCCLFRCDFDQENGFYVDQKYLDILPLLFDGVGIIRHKGCNLADWNRLDCKRTLASDGSLKINEIFEPIFIHFTMTTIISAINGTDPMLKPYAEQYAEQIREAHPKSIDLIGIAKKKMALMNQQQGFFTEVRNHLRIRTRLEAFWKG